MKIDSVRRYIQSSILTNCDWNGYLRCPISIQISGDGSARKATSPKGRSIDERLVEAQSISRSEAFDYNNTPLSSGRGAEQAADKILQVTFSATEKQLQVRLLGRMGPRLSIVIQRCNPNYQCCSQTGSFFAHSQAFSIPR